MREDEWLLSSTARCSASAPAAPPGDLRGVMMTTADAATRTQPSSAPAPLRGRGREPASAPAAGPGADRRGRVWRSAELDRARRRAEASSAGAPRAPSRAGAGGAAARRRGRGPRAPGAVSASPRRRPSRASAPTPRPERDGGAPSLRERGAELLRRSADVDSTRTPTRPTSGSSASSRPTRRASCACSPQQGPQPSVDVRAAGCRSTSPPSCVAPGLNMIGAEAGCRHLERVPAYLNNLYRLGLIWFSREPLRRPAPLPGARGPARGRRGAGESAPRPHRAPQHPPHPVRRGLLRDVPAGAGRVGEW